ncbi:DUF7079 family protein [Rhizobium mongolense]|uniref:DUF7079 family protein n=1 Tax=Rhizobium mongolense TaxID=57676 RepID=UPI00406BCC3D
MLREAPVWHALSNWFLDTELQAEHCRQTAEVLAISGYSSVEPPSILESEVALRSLPTCWALQANGPVGARSTLGGHAPFAAPTKEGAWGEDPGTFPSHARCWVHAFSAPSSR